MQGLIDVATSGVKRVSAWFHSLIARTLLFAFCGLTAFSGMGFIAIGSYISLREALVPWAAGLIVGLGMLLLSLLGSWFTLLYLRKNAPSQTPPKSATEDSEIRTRIDNVAHLGEIVGASLSKSGIRTTDVMIAALVAGTILGASPALRDRLLNRKRHSSDSSSPRSR